MYLGEVDLEQALGAILVHTLRLGKTVLKKGSVLQTQDLIDLKNHQISKVTVARLQEGDIPEDEAALRVAHSLTTENIRLSPPFTGRVNLFSQVKGLMTLNQTRIDKINAVDEAVTIATLPNATVVDVDDMVATIKIIPYSASQESVTRIEFLSSHEKTMRVFPFPSTRVGLIQTHQAGFKLSLLEKTLRLTQQRLAALDATLEIERRCPHDVESVTEALEGVLTQALDLILIMGSSAIADRRDIIPAALTALKGRIIHFGMPVDPGNLLLVGESRQGTPIIGLPSCARSPQRNGLDWILERLIARAPLTSEIIAAMGVGGLLLNAPPVVKPTRPPIGALLLAAGESRRMGQNNKLLMTIDSIPIVVRTFDNILDSQADPIVVVLGYQAREIEETLKDHLKRAQLQGKTVLLTINPCFQEGIGSSARWGMSRLPEGCAGVLICLGDMPWVSGTLMDQLIESFDSEAAAVVPMVGNRQGNPLLWGAQAFQGLRSLQGDKGGRLLLERNEPTIRRVQTDPRVLIDIDTPGDLSLWS